MTPQDLTAAMAAFLHRSSDEIPPELPLTDLVTDSFALVEMTIHLQDEFGVELSHEDFEGVTTVRDFLALFQTDRVG